MTDEELRKAAKESWAVDWVRSQGWNEENLPSDELQQMITAYVAGYEKSEKESQTVVWHDLRKNPHDLPKNPNNLPINSFLNHEGIPVWYESISGTWHYTDDNTVCDDVIAWCEIPMF